MVPFSNFPSILHSVAILNSESLSFAAILSLASAFNDAFSASLSNVAFPESSAFIDADALLGATTPTPTLQLNPMPSALFIFADMPMLKFSILTGSLTSITSSDANFVDASTVPLTDSILPSIFRSSLSSASRPLTPVIFISPMLIVPSRSEKISALTLIFIEGDDEVNLPSNSIIMDDSYVPLRTMFISEGTSNPFAVFVNLMSEPSFISMMVPLP